MSILIAIGAAYAVLNLYLDYQQRKETAWQDFLTLWDSANNNNAQSEIQNPYPG